MGPRGSCRGARQRLRLRGGCISVKLIDFASTREEALAMPLPLIPMAIALVVSGAGGVCAGAKGCVDMVSAKNRAGKAGAEYDEMLERVCVEEERTVRHLEAYGARQLQVQTTTLAAWADWLEQNERKVGRAQRKIVTGVEIPSVDLPQLKKLVHEAQLLQGGATAVVSAVLARQAALGGVRALATAGTGTAIAGLYGAAQESATLAWLGGGTLAAGGGGVAAGSAVLTGVATAPALLVGGITLAIQGDKAKTEAKKYQADVKAKVEEMGLHYELLDRLRVRADEVCSVLDRLVRRAEGGLAELSSRPFDVDRDLELFQRAALLMAEVGRVLQTPLLGEDGDVSVESFTLIEEYAA
jgi:hypothetical protein